jgi:molecular chaperone GrpE
MFGKPRRVFEELEAVTGKEKQNTDTDQQPSDEAAEQQPQIDEAVQSADTPEIEENDQVGTDEAGDLELALAAALDETAACKDAMLRMQAETDNMRKRLARDLERSRRRSLENIMTDLLPVYDSLERGLEVANENATVESLMEGKALIFKMLCAAMKKHGLHFIDPKGEPFNPDFHEAMTMLPSEEHEANTVMEVIQKGFRLNERLIRPAMVVVSRKP